uniref:Hydroxyproline-rich glycoprotein family protein n=1 Tax=Kalanchoe fedtschenkoi TaxID=63787 RepID=A0A7N0VBV0_KALFE
MDDGEEDERQPNTPFWLQNTAYRSSSNRRSRLITPITSTFSSILFSATSFILLLVIAAALIFIFFIIPSLLNFTSQIFRPNSVKRSWDSLNLVLVLFAIICAFLGRTNKNDNLRSSSGRFRSPSPSPSPSPTSFTRETDQWYGEYSDRNYNSSGMMRLRSSSSHPDLRLQDHASSSSWVYADYMDRGNRVKNGYRFSDDTQLRSYQYSDSDWQISPRRRQPPPEAQDKATARNSAENADDDMVANPNKVGASSPRLPSPPPASQPPPPPPPPFNPLPELQTRVKPKSRRTYRTMEKAETREANSDKEQKPNARPPSPPRANVVKRKTKRIHRSFDDSMESRDEDEQQKPPSPPAESELSKKGNKKRGGATKDFLSSFVSNQRRKKKRERRQSSENFDHVLDTPLPSSSQTPPPPPPPPPPPSVFQNLFSSKKGKSKKPASDPPESTQSKSRTSKPTTQIALAQPPIPAPTNQIRNLARGNESPLYGIPAPPPLPPFGMPVWKFVVEGDYVRLKSMNSSRSGSPDLKEDRDDSIRASSVNGERMRSEIDEDELSVPVPAMFCPSPDVNTKADNFIARFRAGLKLEKVNSGNGMGLSRLASPGPHILAEE